MKIPSLRTRTFAAVALTVCTFNCGPGPLVHAVKKHDGQPRSPSQVQPPEADPFDVPFERWMAMRDELELGGSRYRDLRWKAYVDVNRFHGGISVTPIAAFRENASVVDDPSFVKWVNKYDAWIELECDALGRPPEAASGFRFVSIGRKSARGETHEPSPAHAAADARYRRWPSPSTWAAQP